MNILVVSNVEWSDNNAFGNTVSNLFLNFPNARFASIYRRNSSPDNSICEFYYKIACTDIMKNLFRAKRIGKFFKSEDLKKDEEKSQKERKLISAIHKFKITRLAYSLENTMFKIGSWKNENFRKFITDFDPDIIFNFTSTLKAVELIIREILKIKPNCKLVTFLTDDVYEANRNRAKRKVIEYQIKSASKIYAITPSLKGNYERIFGVNIDILRKGCYFNTPVTQKSNSVKTIVYAGNLLYGRDKTLVKLVEEIYNHNLRSENKLELHIYSPTYVSEATKNGFNKEGASKFMGSRKYEEIVEILNRADVVLHVESFDKKQQKIVKNSFSTKIIDALQSGSVLFSIGAKGLASIDITSEIPGTFVANTLDEIGSQVERISEENLTENAMKIRKYAEEHFSIEKVQEKLIEDFNNLIG